MLSKFWGSVLLMAQWQIVYRTPTIPNFSCLYHVVWCLLLVIPGHSMIILSLCSEFDKENSIEFLLISLLLIHFTTVAMRLLSHGPHVTLVMWHTVTVTVTWPSVTLLWHCNKVTWYFPALYLVVVSPRKEKKRKRKEI